MANKVSIRLGIVIAFTASFMIVEIVVGYYLDSLALISDSFHMLSDVLALVVSVWARKFSKRNRTDKMSYGWKRAEIVGALMNGCFLLALCFNIIIEAIQRFWQRNEIKQPQLLLIVGGVGLGINIIGLIILHDGSGHGHSHGHGKGHGHGHEQNTNQPPKERNLNMRSAFLHVLGDALGSVGVIVTSLIIWLTKFSGRFYFDPAVSLFITAILLKSTITLIRQSMKILLQAVPDHLDINTITNDLQKVDDVINIHDIHIWQLNDNLVVASLHKTCAAGSDFMLLAASLKSVLHSHGVHSATIQPEFEDSSEEEVDDRKCLLKCDTKCEEQDCCSTPSKWVFRPEEE